MAASRSASLAQARAEKEFYAAMEFAEALGKVVEWEGVQRGVFDTYHASRRRYCDGGIPHDQEPDPTLDLLFEL